MIGLLIFGLVMMLMAATFWYLELKVWLDNTYRVAYSTNPITRIGQQLWVLFVNIYRFFTDGKYFLIDIAITLFCVDTMGFGEGVTGGVLGLAFSNVVSVLFLISMKRNRNNQEHV
jgi:hypothetical protein